MSTVPYYQSRELYPKPKTRYLLGLLKHANGFTSEVAFLYHNERQDCKYLLSELMPSKSDLRPRIHWYEYVEIATKVALADAIFVAMALERSYNGLVVSNEKFQTQLSDEQKMYPKKASAARVGILLALAEINRQQYTWLNDTVRRIRKTKKALITEAYGDDDSGEDEPLCDWHFGRTYSLEQMSADTRDTLALCEQLRCSPNRTLYIGDNPFYRNLLCYAQLREHYLTEELPTLSAAFGIQQPQT